MNMMAEPPWRCGPTSFAHAHIVPTPSASTLTLPVELRNLVCPQAADARMRARAGGHGDDEHHLVGPRRVGDAHLEGVEMAAHVGGDTVVDRDVDRRAG